MHNFYTEQLRALCRGISPKLRHATVGHKMVNLLRFSDRTPYTGQGLPTTLLMTEFLKGGGEEMVYSRNQSVTQTGMLQDAAEKNKDNKT
jgi:hypothetical protein